MSIEHSLSGMQKEKIVYFVRHGQSEDNILPVFQGMNSSLSEKGMQQARCLAERCAHIAFDVLVSSPYVRAKQTAETIVRSTGKGIEYSDMFVERGKPSRLYGKSHADENAQALWTEWGKSLYTSGMRVEDGENFDDLLERADRALDFLAGRTEQSIVVVTHGFFLKIVIARVLFGDALSGELFERFHRATSVENTGITVLRSAGEFEERAPWHLWIFNDHAHLG